MDVGQAEIASSMAVGELLVVEAQQIKERRVQIMDMNFVFDGREAEFVRSAVDVPPFDAAAGDPGGEAVVIVVASINLAGI